MSNQTDFRLVKPIKKFSEFYNETVFEIPCKVLNIADLPVGNKFRIQIEIVNFNTGDLMVVPGITYKGSLTVFKDSGLSTPFNTTCLLRKFYDGTIEFVVYGWFNPGLLENIFGIRDILDNDDDEIMDVFHSNYKEINEWLKEPKLNQ